MKSYQILQDIFKNTFEQLKYAELKNGILLTLQIGIFYFISTNIIVEYKNYFLCVLLTNIAITLFSFFPNLNNYTFFNSKENDTIKNLFFFESIKHYNEKEYLALVLETVSDKDNKNNKLYLNITNQIITLSKITSKKYLLYKVSFWMFFIFGFSIIIFYFGGKL